MPSTPPQSAARQAGLAVERDASGASFGKQFKRADRSGARWAAVIGDSEAAEGVAVLKDLREESGVDQRLGFNDVAGLLLTADCIITEAPKAKDEAAGEHAHGHAH